MNRNGLDRKVGASEIRSYAAREYVLPARRSEQRRFSIKVGDVVREHGLYRSVPAVCSALKTGEFLRTNDLRLVDATGPRSGLSTTVVYTYEFLDSGKLSEPTPDPWSRLRGALKTVLAELGGGEAYLRSERNAFHGAEENE